MNKLFILFFISVSVCQAQVKDYSYLELRENKKINFGIGLGAGYHSLGIDKSVAYLKNNQFASINPSATAGFFVNFISVYNLKKHWALRCNFPMFHYSIYDLSFQNTQSSPSSQKQSAFDYFKLALPLEVLFKSDIIENFRFYYSLGVYSAYNFTSNINITSTDYLRINQYEQGLSTGIGFMFGSEYSITSLELKFQYGLTNIFITNNESNYSEALEKLKTRNVVLAISF